jgi:hypothetical protein
MAGFLLLHPPLLGPAVWAPCAERLAAAGHRVTVPNLRPALDPPEHWYDRAADRAADSVTTLPTADPTADPTGPAAIPTDPTADSTADQTADPTGPTAIPTEPTADPTAASTADPTALSTDPTADSGGGVDVVVAHSGAGVLVPLVVDRLRATTAVFVDALLPGNPTSDRFRGFLATLPVDAGFLPRWSDWWSPEQLAELVPDPELRARIVADESRLPVAFYDQRVPVPPSWPPPRAGYLALSPAYGNELAEARRLGWPTRELAGGHLDLATRPAEVAADILALAT